MFKYTNYYLFINVLLLLLASCNADKGEKKKRPEHPNVVLILTDDQGYGDFGFTGNGIISTPNLDKLAKQSVELTRFYVNPYGAPTRASLLTGRYHLRTGVSWIAQRKEVMRTEEVTLAEMLNSGGYTTGIFGKWHNGTQFPNDPLGQGFDHFFGFKNEYHNNYFGTTLIEQAKEVKTEGFITDEITDRAIDFIKMNQDNPFFCYVPFNAPHAPFQVPDAYFDKYKKRQMSDRNAAIYGMIENVDENIGYILETLDSLNLTENTIVIFLSDNGPDEPRYNVGMRGTKGSVYEGGTRVPCLIRYGDYLMSQKIDEVTGHIDIFPTIADLCKVSLPKNVNIDGQSLMPLLDDRIDEWIGRPIYTINTEGQIRTRPGVVRTDRYYLVVNEEGQSELYDIKVDPAQRRNIARQLPDLADSLRMEFENWFVEVSKGGIEAPPIPMGYAAAPLVELPAPEALLKGGIRFMGENIAGGSNDWIVNWKTEADTVSWGIKVAAVADYQVEMLYTAADSAVGGTIKVRAKDQEISMMIDSVFVSEYLPSPDRIEREEVYEKLWKKQVVGTFNLPVGRYPLQLTTENIAAGLELKGLVIRRL